MLEIKQLALVNVFFIDFILIFNILIPTVIRTVRASKTLYKLKSYPYDSKKHRHSLAGRMSVNKVTAK